MEFTPDYQRLCIDCEKEDINFQAKEIGFFSFMLEQKWKDDAIGQWCLYFKKLAEIELENAHERLKKLRQELTDWELQQGEF